MKSLEHTVQDLRATPSHAIILRDGMFGCVVLPVRQYLVPLGIGQRGIVQNLGRGGIDVGGIQHGGVEAVRRPCHNRFSRIGVGQGATP